MDGCSIARECDAHSRARRLVLRLHDIAVGRHGEAQLLAQIGHRPHDRAFSHYRHFDTNGLRGGIDGREPPDQGAFNDVFHRSEAKEILDAARKDGGQPEGNGGRRQVQIQLNRRDGLPRHARSLGQLPLREPLLRADHFQVIGNLLRVSWSPCLKVHGDDL